MEKFGKIRNELLQRKEKLGELLNRVERSARRQFDKSLEEQAIQRENEEVLTVVDDSLNLEFLQIENALARIERGEYGICENCGKEIPERRLDALPHIALCFDCAA